MLFLTLMTDLNKQRLRFLPDAWRLLNMVGSGVGKLAEVDERCLIDMLPLHDAAGRFYPRAVHKLRERKRQACHERRVYEELPLLRTDSE